ncbi:hypothetical protein B0H11DRAFT_2025660 [Mycena galericulata]|nr:hypothetical protein B0H11DRAFT_2025660 [Mycena galericulata]
MRFPFPSRAKRKPPQSHSPSQPRSSGPLPDALRTSLLALKESADAFPPLKSAVAGVLAVWEIAERAKHSKSDARGIALRTQEILNVVAEAVPDPSVIPASMLQSIERFTVLLDDIQRRMEAIALTGGVSRVMHLNRNEGVLREINKGLDKAYRNFLVRLSAHVFASFLRGLWGLMHRIFRFAQAASALRLEVQHAELAVKQTERPAAGGNAGGQFYLFFLYLLCVCFFFRSSDARVTEGPLRAMHGINKSFRITSGPSAHPTSAGDQHAPFDLCAICTCLSSANLKTRPVPPYSASTTAYID